MNASQRDRIDNFERELARILRRIKKNAEKNQAAELNQEAGHEHKQQ